MNPQDATYEEFIESVVECAEQVAEQHGFDVETTVEKGEVSIVAMRGELEEGKPVEMSTVISADLARNVDTVVDQIGMNEDVEPPGPESIRPRLAFGGERGDDGGTLQKAPSTLRTAEEIEHRCNRLSE